MPVILPRSLEDIWLTKGTLSEDVLRKIMSPFPATLMESYPVSDTVNDARVNDPGMVIPLNQRQSALF